MMRAELQRKYDQQEREIWDSVVAHWKHPVRVEDRDNVQVLNATLKRCDQLLEVSMRLNGYLRGETYETAMENNELKHKLTELELKKKAPVQMVRSNEIARYEAQLELLRARNEVLEADAITNMAFLKKIQEHRKLGVDTMNLIQQNAEKDQTITRLQNQIDGLLKENEELRLKAATGSKKTTPMDIDQLFDSVLGEAKPNGAKTIDPKLQAMIDKNIVPVNCLDHFAFFGTLEDGEYLTDAYLKGEWLEICRKHNLAIQTPEGDMVTFQQVPRLFEVGDYNDIWG
jgi:hypothetical protein